MPSPSKPSPSRRSGKPPVEGIDAGDQVYVDHPQRGPIAVKVLAHGKDGLTGKCDQGQRHRVPWDQVLGAKARMLQRYKLVEQGADGAILEDDKGRRRFVAGEVPVPEEPAAAAAESERTDDPLLGGMDRLSKAEGAMHFPDHARVLFLKAGPLAQRAGLALKPVTDRAGHQTQRWTKTQEDQPAAKPMKHGEVIQFRHKDVQGEGKIVASGADGVTVQDDAGREHQVRHEHLIHPDKAAAGDGEAAEAGKAETAEGKAEPDTGGGDGGGTIPPAKFKATDYFAKTNDPDATPEKVLAGFPPNTKDLIADKVEKLKGVEQTIDLHKKDGKWTPERQALHDKIIGEILSPEKVEAARPPEGQKPTFTILGGRGGSGKSWFKGNVFDEHKAIVLDADEIKGMLPEYEGWNAAQLHEESSELFDHITDLAQEMGLNIVHDATMKTASKAVNLVKNFKENGYRVEAHYMHLPRQEAAKRAVGRFLTEKGDGSGRFVPPEIVLSNTGNEASFDQVKGLADAWSFRDNSSGKENGGPKLISEYKGDEADGRDAGLSGRADAAAEPGDERSGARQEGDRGAQGKDGGQLQKALEGGRRVIFFAAAAGA